MGSFNGQKIIIKLCKTIFDTYKALLTFYVRYILPIFYSHRNALLPELKDSILLQPAVVLAQNIRQQKLKSEDVVKAYIARIKEVNLFINAIVETRFEHALEEAKKVDKFIQSETKSVDELAKDTPLLGVPISVKSNIACEGMCLDLGLARRKGTKAEKSAEVVTFMKEAGAIQLVLTNTPELCASWDTGNKVYGPTRNPYNFGRSAGGSSGGEGALIASAGSIIGIGNDMCGSIRIPACLNGIFGHKPTAGIVSSVGIYPSEQATNGPMCRYAGDLRLGLKCMAGPNASKLNPNNKVDIKTLNVYFCDFDIGCPFICPLSKEVKQTIDKAVSYFRDESSIKPKRIEIPKLKHAMSVFSIQVASEMKQTLASMLANDKDKEIAVGNEILKSFFGMSEFTGNSLFLALFEKLTPKKNSSWYTIYKKIGQELQEQVNEILDRENTIFVFPAFPEEAPYPIESIAKMHMFAYFCLFNTLGLPATQVPMGMSKSGLPLGIQICGGKYKDYLTIGVAEDLEKSFGGWKCPGKNY